MSLKKYKVLFVLILTFLFSCKKEEETVKTSLDSNFNGTVNPSAALVGKWKLYKWYVSLYNKLFCEHIGNGSFDADLNNENVIMEITENGVMNFYFDDTLKSSYLLTEKLDSGNPAYEAYNYNFHSGNTGVLFGKNDQNFNYSIIGDTIVFNGPDFNANFTDFIAKGITVSQKYIRIE